MLNKESDYVKQLDAQSDEIMAHSESMYAKTGTTPYNAYQLKEELTNILLSILNSGHCTNNQVAQGATQQKG